MFGKENRKPVAVAIRATLGYPMHLFTFDSPKRLETSAATIMGHPVNCSRWDKTGKMEFFRIPPYRRTDAQ